MAVGTVNVVDSQAVSDVYRSTNVICLVFTKINLYWPTNAVHRNSTILGEKEFIRKGRSITVVELKYYCGGTEVLLWWN